MNYLQLGIVVGLLSAIFFWICNRRPKGFPPGPLGLPVVGYLPFFGRLPFKTCVQLGKKYGNVFSLRLGDTLVVILNDWSAIKEALINQAEVFDGRPRNIMYETAFNYDDFAFTTGDDWIERRKFTVHQLKNLGFGKSSSESVIKDEVIVLLKKLQAHDNQAVKIENYFYFFDSLLKIIWSIIGGAVPYDDTVRRQFTKLVRTLFEGFTNTNPFFYMPYLRHILRKKFQAFATNNDTFNKLLSNAFQQHVDTYQDGHIRDFMDAGLEHMFNQEKHLNKDSAPFTKNIIIQIAKDLFLGGTDSSSNTLSWALLYMAMWPRIQQKVQQEMDDTIGRQTLPTFNDRKMLPYTSAVILEIHRYATVAPFSVIREVVHDTTLFGYTLPKGTVVAPNLWAVHRDASFWGDPDVFRPERFLNKNGQVEKPEYLMPFSAGGRRCPGKSLADMNVFLFFACLLHQFKFSLKPGEALPSLEPIHNMTLAPRPFSLIVQQRSDSLLL